MIMQFTINKQFATQYTRSRRNEELSKLQSRHGDVKLKKNAVKHDTDPNSRHKDSSEESNESSTDTDDEEEGEYDSSAERDHEDFLVLYDALCRNDPSLNDPNKQWFHETKLDKTESQQSQNVSEKQNKNTGKKGAVSLRDHEREFLLTHGGVEEESVASAAEHVSKLESDEVLGNLSQYDADNSKALFLKASDAEFKRVGGSNDKTTTSDTHTDELGFLQRRATNSTDAVYKPKVNVDVSKLTFTDNTSNTEAETFLRNFIVNQRWKEPTARPPSYAEVLRQANVDGADFDQLNDDDVLNEDDEFLVKVHNFERSAQEPEFIAKRIQLDKAAAKHRFEEDDKEFIKSYPRKIENTLHQTETEEEGKSTRSRKRQARKARKLETKKAKMDELNRIRRLKLSLLADKVARIKRSCGSGCDLANVDLTQLENLEQQLPDADSQQPATDTVLDLAMHLDEDWDPEKHNEMLQRIFNDEYYDAGQEDDEAPHFSDASDLDSDHLLTDPEEKSSRNKKKNKSVHTGSEPNVSTAADEVFTHMPETESDANESEADDLDNVVKSRRKRRLRGKDRLHRALRRPKDPYDPSIDPDYEQYFDKHYKLTCEDIIPGPTLDEDVYCRFNYRQVAANDYGLSTEDVLTASTRELNSWVGMNRITGYRTEQEEERDQRLYHSQKKIEKKTLVLNSLNAPDAHWWPDEGEEQSSEHLPTKKRKRSKKKKNRRGETSETPKHAMEATAADDERTAVEEMQSTSEANTSGKMPRRVHKIKGIHLPVSRLVAAGLTTKELHRSLNKTKKS